ncbi:TPA: hypothetical protein U2L42_004316 [Citrobacter amalonaticus]|uniref:hypothetical protein n=1 Tax=Citrobacter TaxID=544 RepID=UPI0004A167BB|nr:hypothetical protein [Citrobacter sp. MGH 55]KDF08983.1 hypothetical protein AF41_01871 [Citrobacter sp. MGH 55]GJK87377.1 hypothetical protein TUM17567_36720 [Citrobacter amalonaticus]HEM7922660.1 hypothetical protein [Citrobacter amalonaticus]
MSYFLWQNKLNLLLLLFFSIICIFVTDSTNRYNHLVSYNVYGRVIVTLEKVHSEDNDVLLASVYNSRVNWIVGWRCYSRKIESRSKDKMEIYNWTVEKFANKTVTLLKNTRQLTLSVADCK